MTDADGIDHPPELNPRYREIHEKDYALDSTDEDDTLLEHREKPMQLYDFTIRLMDRSLPYPDKETARIDAEEWAHELADAEGCAVVDVVVEETE